MIGKWRYGIIKYRHPSKPEHRFYGIGELYYKDDPNKIYYCTQEPVNPYVEHDEWVVEDTLIKDISEQMEMMQRDIARFPVFDVDGPFEKEEEDYAGHLGFIPDDLDEEPLEEYLKSIQEEE